MASTSASVRTLHVVAGLVIDTDGSVLVQQRTEPVHFRGLWEFPGGKVENGERTSTALARELDEELGLTEVRSRPWMSLLHDYALGPARPGQPDALPRILLDIRRVISYSGTAQAREGQFAKWVNHRQLGTLDFLDANRPILAALKRERRLRQQD